METSAVSQTDSVESHAILIYRILYITLFKHSLVGPLPLDRHIERRKS